LQDLENHAIDKGAHADKHDNKSIHFVKGFTLIESLLSLALMAILIGIAWPSMQMQWHISRRQDAQHSLLQLHLKQLRWRASHAQYASSLNELGWLSSVSSAGHYRLILQNANSQAYELHATAIGMQAQDIDCDRMSLFVSANGQLTRTSQNMATSDPGQCWRW
jgi:type IV pilus assembly protein PilE